MILLWIAIIWLQNLQIYTHILYIYDKRSDKIWGNNYTIIIVINLMTILSPKNVIFLD